MKFASLLSNRGKYVKGEDVGKSSISSAGINPKIFHPPSDGGKGSNVTRQIKN